jgi:hypothetical protein
MTLRRMLLAIVAGTGLLGAAVLSKETDSTAGKMTAAADALVAAMDAGQKARAVFAFDDRERSNWHFVPYQANKKPLRKGLRLEEMTAAQKAAALKLVEAGTSSGGYTRATTIMSLESILRELEKNGANVRNPEWYFFTVFGTPSKSGKWGWRVEGHHLSLNFTLDGGRLIAATPFFFGANPAEVKAGPRKGLRTLPGAEDFARDLVASFDDDQNKVARQSKQFPEIEEGKSAASTNAAIGLPAGRMTEKQRSILRGLVEDYAARMPGDLAAAELARVREAGLDKICFAYAREDDRPGHPWTYRVQGPTFVIEFLNVQEDSAKNPANHIHSAWRDLPADFGLARR